MNARIQVELRFVSDLALGLACLGTPVAVLLSFLALDDITSDNSTSFTVEYLVLKWCAAWCLVAAGLLVLGRHHLLGAISLLVLAAAVWGQRAIGPGTVPSWQPEYLATVGALIWFLVLPVVLLFTWAGGEK